METEAGAQEAIKKFNGGELDWKTITVNEVRLKTESDGIRTGVAASGAGAVEAVAAAAAGTDTRFCFGRPPLRR